MASRTLVIKTKMDNTEYTAQIKKLENELDTLKEEHQALSKAKPYANQKEDLMYYESKIEKTINSIQKLKEKQSKLNSEESFSGMSVDVDKIGKGLSKTVATIGKWAVALFGIRTAYSLITKATSIVSQYNEQVANDLENIQYTIAMALEPVIIRIIDLVKTLLQYINYLSMEWFGVNLFANATSKAIQNTNKNAKEMKKTLSGFDTANVLNDTSTSSSNSSSIGGLQPLEQAEAPEWLVWIKDNGTLVATILGLIAVGILAIQIAINPIGMLIAGIIALVGLFIYEATRNFEEFKKLFALIGEKIKEEFEKIKSTIRNTFKDIGNFFGGVWNVLVSGCKKAIDKIKNVFISLKDKISNILQNIKNKISGIFSGGSSALKSILPAIGIKIPKMATGGIVNNPGRGVPMGSYIAGESGREGILPLTDSNTMSELGKEIGKWISVNVDLTSKLDSRVLSKQMIQVQNNNSFARNGG